MNKQQEFIYKEGVNLSYKYNDVYERTTYEIILDEVREIAYKFATDILKEENGSAYSFDTEEFDKWYNK